MPSVTHTTAGLVLTEHEFSVPLYVERAFAEETAALIRGTRAWVTSEYEHNGPRADGGRILGRRIDLARGRA